MSDHERLTPSEVAQTTANLRLAAQFLRELIEHPERHEALPDEATVVLLPGDDPGDPELSRANMQMALNLARQGRNVTTWVVGASAMPGPQVMPRWPFSPGEGSGFTYDRNLDVMTVVFSQTDRPSIPTRMNPYMTVLVDSETHTATSMTIANFLAVAVQKAPLLIVYLFHPSTRLIGMTRAELGEIVARLLHDLLGPDGEQMAWNQILEELSA